MPVRIEGSSAGKHLRAFETMADMIYTYFEADHIIPANLVDIISGTPPVILPIQRANIPCQNLNLSEDNSEESEEEASEESEEDESEESEEDDSQEEEEAASGEAGTNSRAVTSEVRCTLLHMHCGSMAWHSRRDSHADSVT